DTFSYTGSGGVNCVFDGPPPNGRQLGSALGTGDYDQIVSGGPGVTTLGGTFHAGIGTVNWKNDSGVPATLVCTAASPCSMIVQVQLSPAGSSGDPTVYFRQNLTYLGVPAAPTLNAPTFPASQQVGLSWNSISGADTYTLRRYASTAGACTTLGSPQATTPLIAGASTTVTGLTSGTTCCFTTQAVNTAGSSPESAAVAATPSLPFGSTVTATSGSGSVTLNFTPVPGATSYTVNIFTGSSCTGSPSSSPSFPGPPPLTVPGLTNGQQYCFQVTAIAGGVTSTPSNAVTATPGAATTYQTI